MLRYAPTTIVLQTHDVEWHQEQRQQRISQAAIANKSRSKGLCIPSSSATTFIENGSLHTGPQDALQDDRILLGERLHTTTRAFWDKVLAEAGTPTRTQASPAGRPIIVEPSLRWLNASRSSSASVGDVPDTPPPLDSTDDADLKFSNDRSTSAKGHARPSTRRGRISSFFRRRAKGREGSDQSPSIIDVDGGRDLILSHENSTAQETNRVFAPQSMNHIDSQLQYETFQGTTAVQDRDSEFFSLPSIDVGPNLFDRLDRIDLVSSPRNETFRGGERAHDSFDEANRSGWMPSQTTIPRKRTDGFPNGECWADQSTSHGGNAVLYAPPPSPVLQAFDAKSHDPFELRNAFDHLSSLEAAQLSLPIVVPPTRHRSRRCSPIDPFEIYRGAPMASPTSSLRSSFESFSPPSSSVHSSGSLGHNLNKEDIRQLPRIRARHSGLFQPRIPFIRQMMPASAAPQVRPGSEGRRTDQTRTPLTAPPKFLTRFVSPTTVGSRNTGPSDARAAYTIDRVRSPAGSVTRSHLRGHHEQQSPTRQANGRLTRELPVRDRTLQQRPREYFPILRHLHTTRSLQ